MSTIKNTHNCINVDTLKIGDRVVYRGLGSHDIPALNTRTGDWYTGTVIRFSTNRYTVEWDGISITCSYTKGHLFKLVPNLNEQDWLDSYSIE